MSPSRLKLNSGKYNERENRSALYLDDEVLETNIPFLNSFRGNCYVSNSENLIICFPVLYLAYLILISYNFLYYTNEWLLKITYYLNLNRK